MRTNPEKQVPFDTTYSPFSKTDEHLRARAKEGHPSHHQFPIKKPSDEKDKAEVSFMVGSMNSSGATVVSSVLDRHVDRNDSSDQRGNDSRGHFGMSLESIASKDISVEENVPFLRDSTAEMDDAGYDLFFPDDSDSQSQHLARGETPRVYHLPLGSTFDEEPESLMPRSSSVTEEDGQ
jgi:hypothetical protein